MGTESDRTLLQTWLLRADLYYGWVVVAACFAGAMVTFATVYSFSVFFGHILAEFDQSHANTSLMFSVQSVVTFGGAAVLGIFVDRYGVRRLLAVATVLVGGGLLGASQLDSFVAVAFSYGVVAAAGLGIVYVVAYASTPRWFERRRGLATAVATSGGGVGILLGPPAASVLIDRVGWQDAYLGLTVAFTALLALVTLVFADRPADLDIDVSGEFAEPTGATTDTRDWRDQLADVRELAWTRAFSLLILGYLFLAVPLYILTVHVVEFTSSAGIGRSTGVLAVSVIGGMNVFGKFLVGPVADRVDTTHVLAACGALMGGATLVLAGVRTPALVLAVVVLFGVGYGGSIALLSPLLAELFGVGDINALFGLTSLAFALSGAVVPFLAGASFDALGSYVPSLVVGGCIGLLSAVVIEVAGHLR
jgi:MFS family permease